MMGIERQAEPATVRRRQTVQGNLRLEAAAVFFVLVLLAAGCTGVLYGPPQDRSRFVSARLAGGNTVVFSFSHFVYRPAQGIAAFPDGGIPRYDTDVNVLATYNRDTGRLKVIRREKNDEWEHGQGRFVVSHVNGPMAIVGQSGQVRGPFKLHAVHWLVDIESGDMTELALKDDLAGRGRALGEMYLVDQTGTLLLITPSLAEAGQQAAWRRSPEVVPELWIRRPGGEYERIAKTRHYERVEDGRVVYWMPETRLFKAYDLQTGRTVDLPGYKHPPYHEVTEGVSVSTHGEELKYGTKKDGVWSYETIPVQQSDLKN